MLPKKNTHHAVLPVVSPAVSPPPPSSPSSLPGTARLTGTPHLPWQPGPAHPEGRGLLALSKVAPAIRASTIALLSYITAEGEIIERFLKSVSHSHLMCMYSTYTDCEALAHSSASLCCTRIHTYRIHTILYTLSHTQTHTFPSTTNTQTVQHTLHK